MKTLHVCAVESDGSTADNAYLTDKERRIIEQMARCSYTISMYRAGISIDPRRLAEPYAALKALEQRP